MKDGFKARNFWGGAIRALTDEEAGRLIKAVFEYTTTGKQPKLQGAEKGIFLMIASILKEDEEEERRQIEKKVKAGAAGGRQKAANVAGANSARKNVANLAGANSATKNVANLAGATDPITESDIYNINNIYNNINNLSQNKNMDQETSKLFSRFWEAYPRHEAKEAAREAFTKLGVDEGLLETMITAIGKWKKTNPANWLRQRRWEDEVPKPAKPKATVIAQQYEQREYDEAYWAEYEARQQREIEEKIALMELEKNKEAGGEKE